MLKCFFITNAAGMSELSGPRPQQLVWLFAKNSRRADPNGDLLYGLPRTFPAANRFEEAEHMLALLSLEPAHRYEALMHVTTFVEDC